MKIVRFQRHLPLTIQFYISCRISGVPPLQSDFSGLSSALKDDTIEPKKRKETRTKPTKMARKKSTLRMTRTITDRLLTSTRLFTSDFRKHATQNRSFSSRGVIPIAFAADESNRKFSAARSSAAFAHAGPGRRCAAPGGKRKRRRRGERLGDRHCEQSSARWRGCTAPGGD